MKLSKLNLVNNNQLISLYTPHIKIITYKKLWLLRTLQFISIIDGGLSNGIKAVDKYIFNNMKHGRLNANNHQILRGVNQTLKEPISLHTVSRATTNLRGIHLDSNHLPMIRRYRTNQYGTQVSLVLNPRLLMQHNPNKEVLISVHKLTSKKTKIMTAKNELVIIHDRKIQALKVLSMLSHYEQFLNSWLEKNNKLKGDLKYEKH